ncbi:MAG: hypothetical protein Kow0069_17450 [Promethearchaeota archaeon]
MKITLKLPIVDKECLLKALKSLSLRAEDVGTQVVVEDGRIVFKNSAAGFTAEFNDNSLRTKVNGIYREYLFFYNKKQLEFKRKEREVHRMAETERQKFLREREAFQRRKAEAVEKMAKKIEEKARAKGYQVRTVQGERGQVQLVLVRRRY